MEETMKLLARTQPLAQYPIHRCLEVIRQLAWDESGLRPGSRQSWS